MLFHIIFLRNGFKSTCNKQRCFRDKKLATVVRLVIVSGESNPTVRERTLPRNRMSKSHKSISKSTHERTSKGHLIAGIQEPTTRSEQLPY